MPLIKPPVLDDPSRVGRLNPWETLALMETGLDPRLPGGADIVRVRKRGGGGVRVEDQLRCSRSQSCKQNQAGISGFFFSSAFDGTRILFQKPSLLWAHRVFLKAGGIVERSLACCQTAWYEFTMNLADLIK